MSNPPWSEVVDRANQKPGGEYFPLVLIEMWGKMHLFCKKQLSTCWNAWAKFLMKSIQYKVSNWQKSIEIGKF